MSWSTRARRSAAVAGDAGVASGTDQPRLAVGRRAVDLDLPSAGRLTVDEGAAHHAGHVELPADDPDVAAGRPAGAHDAGELVEDRGEERGPGVTDERDD